MRIVFCADTFPEARDLLHARLPDAEIAVWYGGGASHEFAGADVLIPTMMRIDAQVMDELRPRLIQQWGSGLEGGDLKAACARGICRREHSGDWEQCGIGR
jgi:lactate dehydrogenase-like 2-hydroxyacid dehydrogenase